MRRTWRCKFRRGSWSIGLAHLFLGTILLLWSGVSALHAWAPDRAAMYWVRVLFGITQAGCYPALGKVTQAWFPLSIRTSLQGWIASFFGRFGGFSANLVFASFMLGYIGLDWRRALLLLAAWGVALGIAVLIVFRNTPAVHPLVDAAELAIITETARRPRRGPSRHRGRPRKHPRTRHLLARQVRCGESAVARRQIWGSSCCNSLAPHLPIRSMSCGCHRS